MDGTTQSPSEDGDGPQPKRAKPDPAGTEFNPEPAVRMHMAEDSPGPADAARPSLVIGGKAVGFAVAEFGPQAAQLGPTAAALGEPLLADSNLTNPAEMWGKVAVVLRSPIDQIPFYARAFRAQQAGAAAVIMGGLTNPPVGSGAAAGSATR